MAPLINEANDDHGTRAQPFLATMLVLDYVNRRLASRMGVPLEGCASHRLKLAVQAYLKRYEEDLAQIQALMRKMKTLNHAAAHRYMTISFCFSFYFKTPQRPILRQDTRWGLPYRMAEHYFDSLGFFLGTTTRSRNSCRAPRTVKRLKTLMAELARVKNMSKALQKDDITM
ncbi:hypothetical protein L914_00036, partial [Phytophthora nicotianae]